MNPADTLIYKLKSLGHQFLKPGAQFSIFALASAGIVAVTFLYLRQRRRRGKANLLHILRAMFARRLYLNPSTYADLAYFLINTISLGGLVAWATLSTATVAAGITSSLTSYVGATNPTTLPDWFTRSAATILFFLAYEFGYWLDHYLKHRVPFLWEMHRPHHTAEVLTPLTVFRVHPLDSLVFGCVLAITGGATAGVVNFAMGKPVLELTLDGTNVLLVVFLYAYIHLQHSEVWIPFRGWLGRLLMSPAHHQIHHSNDPAHFNRNLGSCLAIWDWVFGTLSIPAKESPKLQFGVDDAETNPHAPSRLLLTPVIRVGQAVWRLVLPPKSAKPSLQESQTNAAQ